jgi:FG-GAP-like repeat
LVDSTTSVNSGFAVLINDGSTSFGPPISAPNNPPAQYPSAEQFSSGDVNKDGHPDLLVASVSAWNSGQLYGGRTQIFIGNGDGTFSAGQVLDASGEAGLNPRLVQNAVLTDTDGDGCLDAIVVDSYSDGIVYPGDCHGGFNTTVEGPLAYGMGDDAYGLVAADINGDGYPDISRHHHRDPRVNPR